MAGCFESQQIADKCSADRIGVTDVGSSDVAWQGIAARVTKFDFLDNFLQSSGRDKGIRWPLIRLFFQ